MSVVSPLQRVQLQQMFGSWVSFDETERRLYSHCIEDAPKLIRPVVRGATADAVVQPGNQAQLIALVLWANYHRIPLTPSAKATSRYGGVLPVTGGLIVSMVRMNQVLEIDKAEMSVRVQAGVVWEQLEQSLEKEGLSLRNYPSSAPVSTVGGWLAQGGVGYGSYEFGRFRDNVVSVRVVLPSGKVKMLVDEEVDLISDAQGITGFITEVTVRVRESQTHTTRAVGFRSAKALAAAVGDLRGAGAPIWSLSFINPAMAKFKNRLAEDASEDIGDGLPRAALPDDCYILLLSAPEARWEAIDKVLTAVVFRHAGQMLDQSLAEHEWTLRFQRMSIERLDPEFLPAEAVVPLESLGVVLESLGTSVTKPLTLEGVVQGGRGEATRVEVTLRGSVPDDEARFVFARAPGLIRAARTHGGRACSTGYLSTGKADEVLGCDRLAQLKDFKGEVDRQGIMNPRKVTDGSRKGHLLGAILSVEPFAWFRQFCSRFRSGRGSIATAGGALPATWGGTPVPAPGGATAPGSTTGAGRPGSAGEKCRLTE